MNDVSASISAENDITLTNNKEASVEDKSLLKIYNIRINKIENKITKKLKLYFEILSIPIEKKGWNKILVKINIIYDGIKDCRKNEVSKTSFELNIPLLYINSTIWIL